MLLKEEIIFVVKDFEENPVPQGVKAEISISHNGTITPTSTITCEGGTVAFNAIMGTEYGMHRITIQVAGWKYFYIDIPVRFPARPIISEPIDVALEQHLKGEIEWEIMDNNPYEFSILRNGDIVIPKTQIIKEGSIEYIFRSILIFIGLESLHQEIITIPIDTDRSGIWSYTLIVSDTEGDTIMDEVLVK
ncbi:MAG: hypothetical protein LRZ92_04720, partial [Methanosarcinaceae archaeon]|nr:hypothetical protein [Methanosarcinaceae archaeon]